MGSEIPLVGFMVALCLLLTLVTLASIGIAAYAWRAAARAIESRNHARGLLQAARQRVADLTRELEPARQRSADRATAAEVRERLRSMGVDPGPPAHLSAAT